MEKFICQDCGNIFYIYELLKEHECSHKINDDVKSCENCKNYIKNYNCTFGLGKCLKNDFLNCYETKSWQSWELQENQKNHPFSLTMDLEDENSILFQERKALVKLILEHGISSEDILKKINSKGEEAIEKETI